MAPPTALEKAIHDRDTVKSTLEFLELEHSKNAAVPLTEHELINLLEMAKSTQTEVMDIHKRIVHCGPSDIDVHTTVYQGQLSKCVKLLGLFYGLKMQFPDASNSRSQSTCNTDIRLPRLELPTFNGNLQDWVSFRDMFSTAVHSNTTLSKSQKLTYLKSQLKGEAARQISSMIISDANYDIAWAQLHDRYQNDREIFNAIMCRFHDQPMVQPHSPISIRQLVDVSQECIRSLHVLKIPVDSWDSHLLFIIMRKMDSMSKELWEQSLKDSSIPTLKSLFEFLEQRARALSAGGSQPTKSSSQIQTRSQTSGSGKQGDKVKSHKHQSYLVQNSKPANKCQFCVEQHQSIFKCLIFMAWTVDQREDAIKKYQLCFNCFGDHKVTNCPSTKSCKTCSGKHHTLLHRVKQHQSTEHQGSSQSAKDTPPQAFQTISQGNPKTSGPPTFDSVLATSIVLVPDQVGQEQPCRIFLDQGSNTHYVTESCVRRLRVPRIQYSSESTGLGDEPVCSSTGYAMVSVCSRFDSTIRYPIKALIVKKISSFLPVLSYDPSRWSHLNDLQLADPQWYKPQRIDMLLGAELFFSIIKDGKKTGPSGSPVALNTEFGWVIGGGSNLISSPSSHCPVSHSNQGRINSLVSHSIDPIPCDSTNQLLRKFWEIEEVPAVRLFTKEEEDCQSHFKATYSRDEEGRFIVRLPFKSPCPVRGPSLKIATKRLLYLERRLQNQPAYREEYINFMKEYESLGHMVEVPSVEHDNNSMCYIPHHFVTKDSSTTTKFRVVFDASSKTANGVSLNDTLMVGPTIQDSLINILIRFRVHKIAFTADIAKMYRQVLVAPEDTDLQRILWREDPSQPIKHFKLLTVTYGTAPASYVATEVIQEVADLKKEELPIASTIATRNLYMDDLMSGEPSIQQALESQSQLLELMKSAGFNLRKWSSNSQAVLDVLPAEFRETQSLLSLDPDSSIKTLGICWNPQLDQFRFRVQQSSPSITPTKRSVLSEIAKLFDPVGWLAPVIITAKILMQSLWKEDLQWDEALPITLQQQWNQFQSDLQGLEKLKISRFYFSGSPYSSPSMNRPDDSQVTFNLVGFCDASERAYAAVVYLCAYSETGPTVTSMVTSKTRVAPAKQISLPRLELCGAVLLADLMASVQKALQIKIHALSAWTDSTLVLAWIRSHPSRWKTFVANRVTIIQNQLPFELWGHVRGIDNPADCASRGADTTSFINHPLWWHGPSWLQNGPPSTSLPNLDPNLGHEEEKSVRVCHATIMKPTVDLLEQYSSLTKLVRVTAFIFRFVNQSRLKRSQPKKLCPVFLYSSRITVNELKNALFVWIRIAQLQYFSREIHNLKSSKPLDSKSKLLSLNPFIDEKGLLRVGGRLKNSQLSADQKNPILLPRHGRLTELIIQSYHITNLHAGPQLLLCTLQQQFWIVHGKEAIRQQIRKCVICTRLRKEIHNQIMADLPSFRVSPARAFMKCGVDYAGPFQIRPLQPRSKVTLKAWLAIFVCCTTRAVHIEVVSSLSSEIFLAALRRFVARRGRPSDIFSDCGTNFVGVNREMKEILDLIKSNDHNNKVSNQLSNDGIRWHFNPPAAPHFGGLFEAGVKSIKYHLRRTMGIQRWTFEMLTTTMTQIEAILNSRPLTPVSTCPDDLTALTPGHFLIGAPLNSIPEPSLTGIKENRLSVWQHIQQITQHFWKRWSSEYLSRLQQRPKWMSGDRKIKVGDLVVLKEDNLPPLQWKLARILNVHPGADGVIRVVTLKTATGELKRPVVKVCLLPIDHE